MDGIARRTLLLALASLPWAAHAQPAELGGALPGARLLGQGQLSFFSLEIYTARLWVTEGFRADDFIAHPVALELEYARALVGRQIAERSLVEMKKLGTVPEAQAAAWLAAMSKAFPDMAKGDRLTGVSRPGAGMRFFFNGKPSGEVAHADFARLFLGIWLSRRTSESKLRQALLGMA